MREYEAVATMGVDRRRLFKRVVVQAQDRDEALRLAKVAMRRMPWEGA